LEDQFYLQALLINRLVKPTPHFTVNLKAGSDNLVTLLLEQNLGIQSEP